MSNKEKLEDLLKNVLLLDIEDAIDETFAIIASKKSTKKDEEDLMEYRELKAEFEVLLRDLENNSIEEDEINELLTEFEEMILEED